MTHIYGTGNDQIIQHAYERKALSEAMQEAYFSQLADTTTMPKNHGKAIKQYYYLPIIDDRNINSMGLDATGAVIANGNLYGSSKDVGKVSDGLPILGEMGGRVNRVGSKRIELSGQLHKFGFFTEYTADLLNFDTDAELDAHLERELKHGAVKVHEDKLQIDLLNNAGLVKFTGTATSPTGLNHTMQLTYNDLVKLGIDLDNNKTPKKTTMVTGTRLIDTKTIPDARVAFCGSELIPTLEAMVDYHGKQAFTPAHQYASGTTLLKGEVGRIAGFRIVVVPHMMKWAGAGANATNREFYATNGKYDVFPFLVVGDKAFSEIGFLTNGKESKFKSHHVKPTPTREDPYGEIGFKSTKWFYGFMPQFIQRLAMIKTVVKM